MTHSDRDMESLLHFSPHNKFMTPWRNRQWSGRCGRWWVRVTSATVRDKTERSWRSNGRWRRCLVKAHRRRYNWVRPTLRNNLNSKLARPINILQSIWGNYGMRWEHHDNPLLVGNNKRLGIKALSRRVKPPLKNFPKYDVSRLLLLSDDIVCEAYDVRFLRDHIMRETPQGADQRVVFLQKHPLNRQKST